MADTQDLHQIEYRHHQTKDLSPAASSMTSRESLAAWDSRIRAWVRHPHADMLSESACYQVFANGQAALAWRYWDERAASRQDGTRGRPLVSRVIVGPATVLTAEVALAACRTGPSPDWVGPLPGQVADASELPMVSGEALIALAAEMTPGLDQASAVQEGLQAVVAAALAEPSVPLAISIHDALIQVPLRDGVQCPLLWGLHRITGPLLGSVGRGWSFSTFELQLGEMDPKSLPAIVFREVQGGVKAPPSRWRREAKVRPFEPGALDAGTSYAGMAELAGWLVGEYQERGGLGLGKFIADNGGGAGSLPLRMERVSEALRKAHQPAGATGHRRLAGLLGGRSAAPAAEREDPLPAEPPLVATGLAAAPGFPASESPEADPRGPAAPIGEGPRTGVPQPGATQAGDSGPDDSRWEAPQPGDPRTGAPQHEAWHAFDPYDGASRHSAAQVGAPVEGAHEVAHVQQPAPHVAWSADAAPADPRPAQARYGELASPPAADDGRLAPAAAGAGDDGPGNRLHQDHADFRPTWDQSPVDATTSSREGQAPPPLRLPGRGGPPANARSLSERDRDPWRGGQGPVSSLLKQLELLGEDQGRFESILDDVYRGGAMTPEERGKSWGVISSAGWYETICRNNAFRSGDLVRIFSIIVIPEMAEQPPAEVIARWALEAPVPMVESLLAAARMADTGTWDTVMEILEPALAYRWTIERFIRDYWDDSRAARPTADLGRGDGKGGLFGLRRRPGRR